MTVEEAVEEILSGGKVKCTMCAGRGHNYKTNDPIDSNSKRLKPIRCSKCKGTRLQLSKRYFEARAVLGLTNDEDGGGGP